MANPACIFDMDGVLVDTADYHYETWRRLAEELGFNLDGNLKEQLKGISRKASLDIVLNYIGIEADEVEKKRLSDLKNKWYIESLEELNESVLLPGVLDFLQSLKDLDIDLAVGSASRNAAITLKKLRLDSLFVSIVDGNDVAHTKPNPEVFVNAARDLQYPEVECIVFEDSQKGIKAAKSGGFNCIGIGEKHLLKEADFVISGLAEANYGQIVATLRG